MMSPFGRTGEKVCKEVARTWKPLRSRRWSSLSIRQIVTVSFPLPALSWRNEGTNRCLVNNAMVTVVGPVERIQRSDSRRVTEVTYLCAIHGTLAALRHIRPRDKETIV